MTGPTQDPERNSEVLGQTDLFREQGLTDAFNEQELASISYRLGSLVLDAETELGEHQQDAFNDIVSFFREGGRECYAQLPTGSGKTVLLVELSKKLLDISKEKDEPARVIVLAPTVDLVDQTVGSVDEESGKRRGFKGFAPEIDVRQIHGRMNINSRLKNITEAEVLVTTYDTFRNLIAGLVDNPDLSREDVDAQVAELHREMDTHRNRANQLKMERAAHVRNAYYRQEIADVKEGAERLLELGAQGRISSKNAGVALERICELADEDYPAPELFQHLLAATKSRSPQRVKQSVTWMNKRRKQHRTDYFNDNPKAADEEYTALTQEELEKEAGDAFGLDIMERFVAGFLLRHKVARTPGLSHLKDRADTDKAYDLDDEAVSERDLYHHAKARAKALETQFQFNQAIAQFGLLICDEAHRAIGTETWQAIRNFAQLKDISVVGLTATDQYHNRSMADYFEEKVHELTKQEAIRRKITNPMAIFTHDTGLRFKGVSLDANGDYDRVTIREMRLSEERTMIGVNYAKTLSEMGYAGIMPAIPGDNQAHAKVLAEMINKTTMIDPDTGEERLMRARYIVGNGDPEQRKEYYRQFEAGEIDWLCFVDVIREGWDSDRAKAIINMRPTRSPLLATQRVGRVGRTYPGAPISIAIDLFDGIELEDGGMELPPVLVADVFGLDNVPQGSVAGGVKSTLLDRDFERLRQLLPTETLVAHHSRYVDMFKKAQLIDARGIAKTESGVQKSDWQTFEAIQRGFQGFLPKEIILDAIEGDNPSVSVMNGRSGGNIVPLFNVGDVMKLHQDAPEINPWKLFKDANGTDWISPEGCTVLLSRRFPNIAAEDISDVLRMIEQEQGQKFEKQVARFRINFSGNSNARLGFTHLFKMSEVMERLVPYLKDLATLQS